MAMVKIRKKNPTEQEINEVTNQLADRTYGKEKDYQARTTIALPKSLLSELELKAFQNKQAGINPKSVSALIRESLMAFGYSKK
jgi:hypothetical protein